MAKKNKAWELLHDPEYNKSTSFSKEERKELGLRGLLPYRISSQEEQTIRVLANLKRKETDLEKYILLASLRRRNSRLFYRTVIEYIEDIMPIIYTPTVGQACVEYSHIFRESTGFYITPKDKGHIHEMLDHWPSKDIKAIVITDGQRILGLGDLGSNGMGIPIGKLSLYVACGGIPPNQCLPVMLDVGTNNQELLDDPFYLGYPHKRLQGRAYNALIAEFVEAVQKKYPGALIQFEDFLTPNAYSILNKFKDKVLCFNDDIQGTAAVALAGVFASERITKKAFKDLKIMFLGAGSAATGIADLMVSAFMEAGLTKKEARERLWFVDVGGLVVKSRKNLMPHNLPYAHKHKKMSFLTAIESVKPDVLIGATGVPGLFTKEVIQGMSKINERPVIFALSNPTSKAECTAEQAYKFSKGKVVFASGSPFEPVIYKSETFYPGQGNNAYIFPGLGLGAIRAKAKKIPDELFLIAAKTLAEDVSEDDIERGALYPPLKQIRATSLNIAIAVAEKTFELGLSERKRKPKDMRGFIEENLYDPEY